MKLDQVKKIMSDKVKVKYMGNEYYITACIMRIYQNRWYYQLELMDMNLNSVVIANMEMVEEQGEKA